MNALHALRALWLARAPRERRALTLLAIVLAVALVLQTAWQAWHGANALCQQWPARAQELARLQLALAELQKPQLPSGTASPLDGETLEAALRPELKALSADLALRRSGPRRFVVEGETHFNALIDWLAQTQARHGLHPAIAEAQRVVERPGRVRVMIELIGE